MLRSVDFKAKTRGEECTAAFRPLGEPRKSSWRLKLRKVKLQMNCTRGKKTDSTRGFQTGEGILCFHLCAAAAQRRRSPYMMSARLSLNLLLCFVLALKAAEL